MFGATRAIALHGGVDAVRLDGPGTGVDVGEDEGGAAR